MSERTKSLLNTNDGGVADPPKKIERAASIPITLLTVLRIAVGSATLLIPQRSAAFFGLSHNVEAQTITRLFGSRDLVLGGLLLTASRAASPNRPTPEQQANLKRALYLGLIVDGIDVCSCAFAAFNGNLHPRAIGLVGGGAVLFCALAMLGLRVCD